MRIKHHAKTSMQSERQHRMMSTSNESCKKFCFWIRLKKERERERRMEGMRLCSDDDEQQKKKIKRGPDFKAVVHYDYYCERTDGMRSYEVCSAKYLLVYLERERESI